MKSKKGSLKAVVTFFFIFLAGGLFLSLLRHNTSVIDIEPTSSDIAVKDVGGFAAAEKLLEHFNKHGSEFGYKTANEYLRGAQRLIDSKQVLTFTRANGDKLFYNPNKNEFAVLSGEGIIRTYFKPRNGYRYWQKQIRKK
jgi:hypothetical protein